jgi:hypothetical protein
MTRETPTHTDDLEQPTKTVQRSTREIVQENEKKWGPSLIRAGWMSLPNTIVLRQKALGLDALDMNILLVLFTYWWRADDLPFPSKQTIANIIGVDPSTVRRRIQKMEKAGFIRRIERRVIGDRSKTNLYDFAGLVKEATPFAMEELEQREQRKAERSARIRRKGKPKFKVVEP